MVQVNLVRETAFKKLGETWRAENKGGGMGGKVEQIKGDKFSTQGG